MQKFILLLASVLFFNPAFAAIHDYRWTQSETLTDSFDQVLEQVKSASQLPLTSDQFVLIEERTLATSRFKTYLQIANGVPVKGAVIRSWAHPETALILQLEAHVDDGSEKALRLKKLKRAGIPLRQVGTHLKKLDNTEILNQTVRHHSDDRVVKNVEFQDQWNGADLERVLTVTGRRGVHTIVVSHLTGQIKSQIYREHPQADIPALVYPIYEQSERKKILQPRIAVTLKHLNPARRWAAGDTYAPLRNRRYFEDKIDPIRGETPEGQAEGYWSPNWLLREARALFESLPVVQNDFTTNGGMALQGRYATINIHPDVAQAFQGVNFNLGDSPQLTVMWKPAMLDDGAGNVVEKWEVIPRAALLGRPIDGWESVLNRQARQLSDHNPVEYLNDGFDEIQVYYAINQLMESLHEMGFTDQELSTRPFHAFLYDPDVSMRDNAYYTNDTINFTTYSPGAMNYARDNSTIWHELGHGVMDRLMGDLIVLADSGGLAEGMADFVAQLVVQDVTGGASFEGSEDFRIKNQIGFHLTNESHDDGEAYGGAMHDILKQAWAVWGRDGLRKVTDLTMEAMRLTRNHPALTANDWFQHMLYADELGRQNLRVPGELRGVILEALRTRNFQDAPAKFTVLQQAANMPSTELTDKSVGSRYNPHMLTLNADEKASFDLNMQLVSSGAFQFRYPVRLEIGLNGGPLQGALKWENESAGPLVITIEKESDLAHLTLSAMAGCEFINREDGSCSDYAYLQVYNADENRPVAKKRFYVRVKEASQNKPKPAQ